MQKCSFTREGEPSAECSAGVCGRTRRGRSGGVAGSGRVVGSSGRNPVPTVGRTSRSYVGMYRKGGTKEQV